MRRRTTRSRRLTARVLSATISLALVLVTGAALLFVAPSLLGYERYVITGGSMTGSIAKGSVVFEEHVPVADLEVGDVVTYLPPADSGVTNLVTHRIIDVREDDGRRTFRTQGDANPDPDPWSFSLVDGTQPVVRHSVPWLGYAVLAIADRETRMLVVGAPAAVIALMSLVELVGALRGSSAGPRRREESAPSAAPASSSPQLGPAAPLLPLSEPLLA